jgi:hypothetical protein
MKGRGMEGWNKDKDLRIGVGEVWVVVEDIYR